MSLDGHIIALALNPFDLTAAPLHLYLPCLHSINYLPPVYLSPARAGVEINH